MKKPTRARRRQPKLRPSDATEDELWKSIETELKGSLTAESVAPVIAKLRQAMPPYRALHTSWTTAEEGHTTPSDFRKVLKTASNKFKAAAYTLRNLTAEQTERLRGAGALIEFEHLADALGLRVPPPPLPDDPQFASATPAEWIGLGPLIALLDNVEAWLCRTAKRLPKGEDWRRVLDSANPKNNLYAFVRSTIAEHGASQATAITVGDLFFQIVTREPPGETAGAHALRARRPRKKEPHTP